MHRLASGQYAPLAAQPDGFVLSEALGLRLGHEGGPPPKLLIEDAVDPSARTII